MNRKQTDVAVNLPRELAELEPRIRDLINSRISRGRMNVVVAYHSAPSSAPKLALDTALAQTYYRAIHELQQELGAVGQVSIETVLRAPGVMRLSEESISPDDVWPHVKAALAEALDGLIKMREKEGKHLAKDLIQRLKLIRQMLKKVRQLHPQVVRKYRQALQDRLQKAGLELKIDDDRLAREIILFADRSDISEELTRLESHLAQFAHQLRKNEPVGRSLDFMTQEIYRELNTLSSKANDVEISQLMIASKSELEKIREQIQNIE